MMHNHAPRCCCEDISGEPEDLCPGCPDHGELTRVLFDTEALCGFRNLADARLTCTYPPHAVDTPHSWQGWRHAIDPNEPGRGGKS